MPDHVPSQTASVEPTPGPRSSPVPSASAESHGFASLGTDGLAPAESQRQTRERLVVFSDAVVAIALTLLALELPVPHGDTQHELWVSFVHLLSRDYLTFTISFLVTAGFWLTHHRFFQRVDRADTGLTRLNMLCLLMIVLLPFASRVLGEDGDFPFGVVFYALTICVTALSYLAMVLYAQRHSLTREGVPAEVMRSMAVSIIIVAAVFLLSVPVAFLNTNAASYIWLSLIIIPRIVHPLRKRWSAAGTR